MRKLILALLVIAALAALARASAQAPGSGMVAVTPGVRLNYLDWGGRGETVLLVPGLFANADIYDDFAPKLTDKFRVLAISRRGHGRSDEPETGYEPDSLVQDIRAFLDSMHLERVHLVGHSLAGMELTLFATRYPERVLKLVYLDAAYDRTLRTPPNPIRLPDPSPQDMASADKFIAFMRGHPYWTPIWSPATEAALRASLTPADGNGLMQKPGPATVAKIAGPARTTAMTYDRVRAPILAIYASVDTIPLMAPGTPRALRDSAIARQTSAVIPNERASIAQLRRMRPDARIVEMPGAHHYLFIQHRDEVLRLVRDFLSGSAQEPDLVGSWRGTSLCVDKVNYPACKDEQVIYDATRKGASADTVTLKADKIVNGAREFMGEFDFVRAADSSWVAGLQNARVKLKIVLRVRGTQLTGALTDELAGDRRVRALSLERVAP